MSLLPTPRAAVDHSDRRAIASGLRANGLQARAEPITDVKSVTVYQAVVLGGNAHMSHWLDAAVRFARHHRKELADRAVWLFSSGPAGTARSAAEDTPPHEFHQLVKLVEPRGEHVFAGSQPDVLSREDEEAIDAWTEEIAADCWPSSSGCSSLGAPASKRVTRPGRSPSPGTPTSGSARRSRPRTSGSKAARIAVGGLALRVYGWLFVSLGVAAPTLGPAVESTGRASWPSSCW